MNFVNTFCSFYELFLLCFFSFYANIDFKEEYAMEINERIRQIRKGNKLTMEQFGQKLCVKKNTVSQWESGINNPSDQTIMLICKEFNINEEWLRNGKGPIQPPFDMTGAYLKACEELGINDPLFQQIIINYSKFSTSEKEVFRDYLHKLATKDPNLPTNEEVIRMCHSDSDDCNTKEAKEA
jgi:transcriptional regulator with XRE-family HTH domain